MNHFAAYIKMALGLPCQHTDDMFWADYYAAWHRTSVLCSCRKLTVAHVEYVWTGEKLVDEICAAKGITRERFIRSMAAPKPSRIAHLIYNDELMTHFGKTLPDWPKGQGLIIPRWENKQIVEIKFYPLRELLKPRMKIN